MSEIVIQRSDDYLVHYGIKGQKWGVRRYENEDGTLTEAGKARYNEARRIVNTGFITGNQKAKNAFRRGAVGGALGAGAVGAMTFDPGSTVTNKTWVSIDGYGDVGGTVEKSYFRPGKGLNIEATGAAYVAGFAATAVGSFIKDTVHNKRVANAQKFIREHKQAFEKTYKNAVQAFEEQKKSDQQAFDNSMKQIRKDGVMKWWKDKRDDKESEGFFDHIYRTQAPLIDKWLEEERWNLNYENGESDRVQRRYCKQLAKNLNMPQTKDTYEFLGSWIINFDD